MLSFRFIHTGDIHLDSPLKGLAGQQSAAAERIRAAPRAAFENLISQAIEEEVDFVVIAGDLYDGDWRDYQTGLYFVKQMGRLSEAKIPVFLLHGNHDAESQITRKLTLPPNVSVFSARKPETFQLPHLNVALHGHSFRQRDVTDNLVPAYPPPLAGCFNIGVLHTGLGGMPGHANYAPCAIEDLINKGYDYWALAHVHQAAVLNERPHVVFCGNLQGRHIRETGAKGASLVTSRTAKSRRLRRSMSIACAGSFCRFRWTSAARLPTPSIHKASHRRSRRARRARASARVQNRAKGADQIARRTTCFSGSPSCGSKGGSSEFGRRGRLDRASRRGDREPGSRSLTKGRIG